MSYLRRIAFVNTKPDPAMARTGADPRCLRTVSPLVVCKLATLVHAGVIVLPALFPLLGILSVVACVFFRSGKSGGRET